MNETASYEKWIWTELVGFDNTSGDQGVSAYIDNLGFQPEAICLFVSSPDFILLHPKLAEDATLPKDCCTYAAHSFNDERKCQEWTGKQVRDLISNLHKHNVRVFVSVMTWYTHNKFHQEWVEDHKEMLAWENVGPEPSNNINPLKRLRDGSYFEDFFLNQLLDVMHYYGFDGWHAADGWGPAMNNIYDADFSDDMVEQFVRARGVCLPEKMMLPCAGPEHDERVACKDRADWIWRNLRRDWIEFYTDRWQSFFRKICSKLREEQKSVMVNSAMTRDPFEAIFRFGVDYKKLVDAGIDGFVVETGAAAQDLVSGDRIRHYDYLASFMLIRAYVPETKLVFLHVIQDHCENFNGLGHMPTAIEKEVIAISGLRHYNCNGEFVRSADGFLVCLGDSLLASEWSWLHSVWDTGFAGDSIEANGPTLVWSDSALYNQLEDFSKTRRWHLQKILFNLMQRGAQIQGTVNVNDVKKISGPVLIINPATFTAEELSKAFAKNNRQILAIGTMSEHMPKSDYSFEDSCGDYPLSCWMYGDCEGFEYTPGDDIEDELQKDVMDIVDAHFFINELEVRTVTEKFLEACVAAVGRMSGDIKLIEGQDYNKLLAYKQKDGSYRLYIKSDSHYYTKATIDMGREVISAKSVTAYPYAPIDIQGNILKDVAVPNKGIVILSVKTID